MGADATAVRVECTCIHPRDCHDPVSGACLAQNEVFGPCPCQATPAATRRALEVADKLAEGGRHARRLTDAERATLAGAEARVTRVALDLLSRVLTGQVEIVAEVLRDFYLIAHQGQWTMEQHDAFARAIRDAKAALGLPRNGSHSIYNITVHPAARLAWSLIRRMEGREDDLHRAMDAEDDAQWRAAHGSPWWGGRSRRGKAR